MGQWQEAGSRHQSMSNNSNQTSTAVEAVLICKIHTIAPERQ
jgi:hypothetical protein